MRHLRLHDRFGVGFIVCCLAFAAPSAVPSTAAGESLKVMTFNIKNGSNTIGFDQEESWNYIFGNDRRDRVVNVINSSSADIVGVQEMRLGQLEYLEPRLPNYDYYGVGRDDGTTSDPGERSGIFYNSARLSRFAQGEFWLSETPTVPGTTFTGGGGDTNNPRMATWVKLHDNQLQQDYFVINTHWSLDSQARLLSGQLMRDTILQIAGGLPLIVTGDFNETASSQGGYGALVRRRNGQEFALDNSYFESGAPAGKTAHGYNGGVAGSPIDFVLHSRDDFAAVPGSGAIVRTTFDGYYPSDHYPVEVTLDVLVPPVPGDYDGNGSVGAEDYNLWKSTFGSTSEPAADGNEDGVVDAADYAFWRDWLGTSNQLASQTAIPEPASLGLLISLTVLLVRQRRTRSRRSLLKTA